MDYRELIEERDWPVGNHSVWYWPKFDQGLWNIRYELGEDQIPKIMDLVKERNVCIQAGGALGIAPLIYSNHFKTVYTFEPNPVNFYFLNLNIRRDNVIKFNTILGEKAGFAGIANDMDHDNRGVFTVQEQGNIPIISIDSLDLPTCDLIHLDLEGYEEHALRGAYKTIDKFSPVVVGEGIAGRDPCKDLLESLGYQFQQNVVSDAIFIRKS